MKLSKAKLTSTIAVKNLRRAKEFYGKTLGLELVTENPVGLGFKCADGNLFVYASDNAGTGKATCISWAVTDIEALVKDLKSKSISFSTFEIPEATWKGDVAEMGPMKAAWFNDPDGNILGLTQGEM